MAPVPPRPAGLGAFGSLASLLAPYRPLWVCSSLAPRQRAKSPPAKSELIFAQTLGSCSNMLNEHGTDSGLPVRIPGIKEIAHDHDHIPPALDLL